MAIWQEKQPYEDLSVVSSSVESAKYCDEWRHLSLVSSACWSTKSYVTASEPSTTAHDSHWLNCEGELSTIKNASSGSFKRLLKLLLLLFLLSWDSSRVSLNLCQIFKQFHSFHAPFIICWVIFSVTLPNFTFLFKNIIKLTAVPYWMKMTKLMNWWITKL